MRFLVWLSVAVWGYGSSSADAAVRGLSPSATPTAAVSPHADATQIARKSTRFRKGRKRKKRGKKGSSETTGPKTPSPSSAAADHPGVPANLPPPPPFSQAKARVVAILPLHGLDIPEELLAVFETAVVNEVDDFQGTLAVTPTDVRGDLEPFGFDPKRCEGDVACLALAGRYARCHLAVETVVAALGGTISVSFRLIDTVKRRELGRVAETVAEEPTQRSKDLHRLAVQLLLPETYVGSLRIQAVQPDAEVYLDDRLVGTTPLRRPLTRLTAGPHILRVSKPGFTDLNQFVDVVYRRSSSITVDLESATVSGLITEVESNAGFGELVVLTQVEGIEVRVDGDPQGTTPLEPLSKVGAGLRRLSFRGAGLKPLSQELNVVAGKRLEIGLAVHGDQIQVVGTRDVEADAPVPTFEAFRTAVVGGTGPAAGPTVAAAPLDWSPSWKFTTGLVCLGLGAAGFSTSGYFGVQVNDAEAHARTLANEYEDPTTVPSRRKEICGEMDGDRCVTGQLADIDKTGKQQMVRHFAALGVGVGMVVLGGALILFDILADREPPRQTNTSVGVAVLPSWTGGHLSVAVGW